MFLRLDNRKFMPGFQCVMYFREEPGNIRNVARDSNGKSEINLLCNISKFE